jgi:ribonuclease III
VFFFGKISDLFKSDRDKQLKTSIENITGFSPGNINLYKTALRHASAAKDNSDSYERLEYLGDAVLGTVIAELLFKKYPYKSEGFLTEIRARIVNREELNKLGFKLGLNKIVTFNSHKNNFSHKSLYGDALEAMIGAVYLDKGFEKCRYFILRKLINPHFDLEEIVSSNKNFKSMLIEWAQKESKDIKFIIIKEVAGKNHKEFTAEVVIDNNPVSRGEGLSKKKAEQAAAEKACSILDISGISE